VSWLFLTMRSEANFGARFMADKIMPLSDALEGYELFDSMKVQKVVFKVDSSVQGQKLYRHWTQ